MSDTRRTLILMLAVVAGMLWVAIVVTFVPDAPPAPGITPTTYGPPPTGGPR